MQVRAAVLFASLALLAATGHAQPRYISDELVVPLRTGPSTRNAITRNLRAGTPLEILEQDEESGYARVRVTDRGTEGWLETQYLAPEPIARDRLAAAQTELAASQGRQRALEQQVQALSRELEQARRDLDATRASSGDLTEELQDVREASAEALAVRAENEQLEERLRAREQQVQTLTAMNGELASRERQNWFVVGAAVLAGGIVLGLVAPSLRPRRRREW